MTIVKYNPFTAILLAEFLYHTCNIMCFQLILKKYVAF